MKEKKGKNCFIKNIHSHLFHLNKWKSFKVHYRNVYGVALRHKATYTLELKMIDWLSTGGKYVAKPLVKKYKML